MKLAGGDLSRLVTMGDTLLAWEGPGFKMTAADRTSGKVLWKFELQNAPVPEWPPATPEGVFSDLRHLEADLRRLNHRIDALLREKGVGPETQAVQSQRNDLRELLRQKALGDNLYLVSGQDLFSIDRRSGGLRWKKPLGFLPSARPVASQDRVFVVDGSSQQVRVYSVQHQGDEMTPIPGPVVGGLAYSDPLLSFVGRDGFVHAHKGTDGTLVWKEEIKGKVTSPPAVALARRAAIPGRPPGTITRLLLVPAGRMLYAFDQDAGVLLWKVECSSEITSVPIWAGDTLYLKTADQNLIALELLPERAGQIEVAGRLRWKLPGGERILLRGRDLVYVLATEPEVIGVRALTGEPVSRFSLGSFRDVATNLEDGMLYVARPGGWVEALLEIPYGVHSRWRLYGVL
ncbi:MAG TPA: PQQ-binding-like beta-propeller repeat protein [Planctomycetota bacterium]|nr:PQQ-binding-like beta-propeller repeat protein [Planctomycetota bacterium]